MTGREDILKALEIIRLHKELRKQGKVKKLRRVKSAGSRKFSPRIAKIMDDVAKDYERGVKVEEIKKKYGISDKTLYRILFEKGVELRGSGGRPSISTKDLRALVKYLRGVKVKDLAIPKWRLSYIRQFFQIPKRQNLDPEKKERIVTILKNFLKDYRCRIVDLPVETVEGLRKRIVEVVKS